MFNQQEFNDFILANGIIKTFNEPITLKSGKKSNLYVNWRTVAEDAYLMDQLTDFVLAFAQDNNIAPDTFYGVPEGATKLGILTQFKYALKNNPSKGSHTLAMGRAKPKEHGDPKDRYFVGSPQGSICILEDVTTTGGSLIDCIKGLQAMGHTITAAIGLTNRNETLDGHANVADAINELNVPYFEMSSAQELIRES
tara:strand:- start:919 stop:1509 length:591 start_codon:yes stop_codon:yes gene_type:complete